MTDGKHQYPTIKFQKKKDGSTENGTNKRLYIFFKIVNPKYIEKQHANELGKILNISGERYAKTIVEIEDLKPSDCKYFFHKNNIEEFLPKVRDWIEETHNKEYLDKFYLNYPYMRLDS